MEKEQRSKKPSISLIIAMVILCITLAIAIDGILIQKLSIEALRYPLFCMGVIVLAATSEIIQAIKKTDSEQKPVHYNAKNFLTIVVMVFSYVIIMWLFGFVVASIAITIAFTLKFKIRKPLLVNIFAAIVIIALFVVFRKVLYIFLPNGILFDLLF